MNAGQQRRFLVAADGHGVAAEGGVVEQPAKEQDAQQGDDDGHRQAEQLAVAEHEELLLGDAHGLAVGEDVAQAAHDLHGRQGRDQGVDLELGDHQPIDQTHHQTHGQGGGDAEKDAVEVAHHHRGDHPGTGDDRPHREVEVAGGQAEQHGAGGDAHGGDRQTQTAHVQRREEVLHEQRAEGEDDDGGQHHGPVVEEAAGVEAAARRGQAVGLGGHGRDLFSCFHQARVRGRASCSRRSSLNSARATSPVMAPSLITRMRSATPMTSIRSLETTTTAMPRAARSWMMA